MKVKSFPQGLTNTLVITNYKQVVSACAWISGQLLSQCPGLNLRLCALPQRTYLVVICQLWIKPATFNLKPSSLITRPPLLNKDSKEITTSSFTFICFLIFLFYNKLSSYFNFFLLILHLSRINVCEWIEIWLVCPTLNSQHWQCGCMQWPCN